MPHFFSEQVAIVPPDVERAMALLAELGLREWVHDIVVARGSVDGCKGITNVAALSFNYEATRGVGAVEPTNDWDVKAKPLELEILHYEAGRNWASKYGATVSHFGMHCTDVELHEFREVFKRWGIAVAQEVNTHSHVNPAIAGKRWYTYVIFETREILGVDLKFIVRREEPQK